MKKKLLLIVTIVCLLAGMASAGIMASAHTPEENIPDNTVTIYYDGFENPNIHYQCGDGEWTKVPGVAMEKNIDSAYPYKAVINIGEETILNACFNDGAGNWDNNNKKNYTFKPGIYTVSEGIVTNAAEEIKLAPSCDTTTVYIKYTGYKSPNMHYAIGDGEWTAVPGVTMQSTNELEGYNYKLCVKLDGAKYITACFNEAGKKWDNNNGNNYVFGTGSYTFENGVITQINAPAAK